MTAMEKGLAGKKKNESKPLFKSNLHVFVPPCVLSVKRRWTKQVRTLPSTFIGTPAVLPSTIYTAFPHVLLPHLPCPAPT